MHDAAATVDEILQDGVISAPGVRVRTSEDHMFAVRRGGSGPAAAVRLFDAVGDGDEGHIFGAIGRCLPNGADGQQQ